MKLTVCIAVLLSSAATMLADDAAQILKGAEDTYNALNSYDFEGTTVSETRVGSTDTKSETTFVVAYEPSKFRIEYDYPTAGNWIRVSDGKTLWKYRSLTKELNKTAASEYDVHEIMGSPIGSLYHISQGLANPSVVGSETVTAGGQSFDCYIIQADNPGAVVMNKAKALPVKFWIDKKSHLVVREQSGSVSGGAKGTEDLQTVNFTRLDVNKPIPDTVFTFTKPRK